MINLFHFSNSDPRKWLCLASRKRSSQFSFLGGVALNLEIWGLLHIDAQNMIINLVTAYLLF